MVFCRRIWPGSRFNDNPVPLLADGILEADYTQPVSRHGDSHDRLLNLLGFGRDAKDAGGA